MTQAAAAAVRPPQRRPVLAVMGAGVWSTGNLPDLLDDYTLQRHAVFSRANAKPDAVLAWGCKPSAEKSQKFSQQNRLPLIRIEDGFLRSIEPGGDSSPLSIVVDDLGIYYNANEPSRLEMLIARGVDAAQKNRADALRQLWCQARVSKYNHAPDAVTGRPLPERFVLVIDQTWGDVSISHGLADANSFQHMLDAALQRDPDCPVVLKVHPDVVAGRKRGHFDLGALNKNSRIHVCADSVHPVALIEKAEAVYTVTSQVGFEALLHGKPVHTFGMPFYAGWGLTIDVQVAPVRRKQASLDALVHAALIDYPRYIDPETGARCEVERLIGWMALQRRERAKFPAQVHARNFSPWKRPVLKRFLSGSAITFLRGKRKPPEGAVIAVWGRPATETMTGGNPFIVVEDGFLRSVGLGADLVQPVSWVFDDVGIYYDATRPSRLELLLAQTRFDTTLCQRAADFRAAICKAGITKYNLAGDVWQRPANARRVILVPGQVESDASIFWGAPEIKRNIDLLRAVRAENPDAWIVYKPHPDVVAGVRRRGGGEKSADSFCDEIVTDSSMDQLLDAVDEVHVLTSLAGFEALLRGKKVTCWGQPFYAGWGLTEDRIAVPRRTRQLTLDELVAATLLLYPVYVSRVSGAYTTPERALAELLAWRDRGAAPLSLWRRIKRVFMRARAVLTD